MTDRKIEGLIELVDLAPTFLDAAGLIFPSRCRERAFYLCLREAMRRNHVVNRYILNITILGHTETHGTMLRTKEEKIVVFHGT